MGTAGGAHDLRTEVYPALVVLSGLPGCGKSHFARALAARAAIIVVSSDRVRQLLYARPSYSEAEHGAVHGVCCRLVARALGQGQAVVLDATNLRAARRHLYHDLARAHDVPFHLVAIEGGEADVRARLRRRAAGLTNDGSVADERVYERMLRELEPITEPHLYVDSTVDIGPAADMLVALLRAGAPRPAAERERRDTVRTPSLALATAATAAG